MKLNLPILATCLHTSGKIRLLARHLANLVSLTLLSVPGMAADRPNILWISWEDTSPWMRFCGEEYAITPHLDALARRSVHYTRAFASAPVCSPARFAIFSGAYATTYGTQRLRSTFAIPDEVEGFPALLRRAGYYCTNNAKTDYNTSAEPRLIAGAWDQCDGEAHWRTRKSGQPFFAVFNLTQTHQSRIFESTPPPPLAPAERHDPDRAPLPPYFPDTPAARWTMARVHDCITAMDKRTGEILAQLEHDGLAEDTIVFFWTDHGQGIPRGKRTLWDTGLQVPMLVYFPQKYRHLSPAAPGSRIERLVSLVDLGPTLLSVLDLTVPSRMQGRAFLGREAAAPREHVFGARDRVDEANDVSRSVRDGRYLYVRNFMPDLSWNQPDAYTDQLEFRRELTRLAAEGRLNADQMTFAGPRKYVEELYDTQADPWQLKNLAAAPAQRPVLERMRKSLRDWQRQTRDLGMIHEWQAAALEKSAGSLHAATRTDAVFPLDRVLDTAWRIGLPGETRELGRRLSDADSTVRYWAAVGLRVAGREALEFRTALLAAMNDASLPVRIEAAGILAAHDADKSALRQLTAILPSGDGPAALHAARTLQMLGESARPAVADLNQALPRIEESFEGIYARWSVISALNQLSGRNDPVISRTRPPPEKDATKKRQ